MPQEKLGGVVFLPHLVSVVAFLPCVLLGSLLAAQRGTQTSDADTDVRLSTIPRRVFVDNDGIVEPWPTESFIFFVVVEDDGKTPVAPAGARVELLSKGVIVQALELSRQAVQMVRDVRFKTPRVALSEAFDLRHQLSVPVSLNVDRVRYRLTLTRGGAAVAADLEFPVERYESKAELLCPVKGRFMIVAGHDANEPHALGWSQQHAYDIMSLGPSFGFARNEGRRNDEYFSWGQPVLAPADGIVVSSRNDVIDQPRPGVVDAKLFETLSDPRSASTGNTVVIDHGQGEYSALSHLQRGSVSVKAGQRVRRGDQVGRIGSSGSSDLPHLHYQLMAGPDLFRSDGLPAQFTNVWLEAFTKEAMRVPKAKRGIPLTAR